MEIKFKTQTTEAQIEAHIRSLRPQLSEDGKTILLRHWAEEEDEEDAGVQRTGTLKRAEGAYIIECGSKASYVWKEGSLSYKGPFRGLGASPYAPPFTAKEVETSTVKSWGFIKDFKGSFAEYLKLREGLVTKVWCNRFFKTGLPDILIEAGWGFWAWQMEEPVEGFESRWPGTPVQVGFRKGQPKASRAYRFPDAYFFDASSKNPIPAWAAGSAFKNQ